MSQRYIEGPAKASVPISYGVFTGIVCGMVLGFITADAPLIGAAVGAVIGLVSGWYFRNVGTQPNSHEPGSKPE